jgi:hypothetical protein
VHIGKREIGKVSNIIAVKPKSHVFAFGNNFAPEKILWPFVTGLWGFAPAWFFLTFFLPGITFGKK